MPFDSTHRLIGRGGATTATSRRLAAPCSALLLALLTGLLLAKSASAVPDDDNWSDEFDIPGLLGRVFAVGTYDGNLVAGGYESLVGGGKYLNHLALYDGIDWRPLGGGVDGSVRAILQYGDDLIVAGEFSVAGGQSARGVARWDGASWHAMGSGLHREFTNSEVWDLAVYHGELYAVGLFDRSGSQILNGVARWDGTAWLPVGSGVYDDFEPVVYCMTVHDDQLWIAGSFDSAGGATSNNVAYWDGNGWSAPGNGAGNDLSYVFDIESFAGDLYVGGTFSHASGVSAERIARWDGNGWNAVGTGIQDWDIGAYVYELITYQGALYVGGTFIEAGDVPSCYRVARWDGGSWGSIGGVSGSDIRTGVFGATVWNEQLVVGGEFGFAVWGAANDVWRVSDSIAAYDGTSGDWSELGPGLGLNAEVRGACLYEDGIVAVGRFSRAGTEIAAHCAYFDGDQWASLGIFSGNLWDVVEFEGDLVVIGEFTSVDGVVANGTARYDGTSWQAMGSGYDGITLYEHHGELYAGGTGHPRKWNGSQWEIFSDAEIYGYVYDFVTWNDLLVIGGSINVFPWDPQPRGNVAAWNGSEWITFGSGTNDGVEALAVYEGDLLVGGWFDQVDGQSIRSIARWDGSSWTGFGNGLHNSVNTIAILGDGFYVGGNFNHIVGDPIEYVGMWNGDSWEGLGSGMLGWPEVFLPDASTSTLYMGGGFIQAGGKPSFYFAAWQAFPVPADAPEPASPPAPRLSLAAGPNPFRGSTEISLTLAEDAVVTLDILDVAGRKIDSLHLSGGSPDGRVAAGEHHTTWDGRDPRGGRLPAGVYYLSARTAGESVGTKLVRVN